MSVLKAFYCIASVLPKSKDVFSIEHLGPALSLVGVCCDVC